MIEVSATCKTTSGHTVGWLAPVHPELYEDRPVLQAVILEDLRDVAAGDPLREDTLTIERTHRVELGEPPLPA